MKYRCASCAAEQWRGLFPKQVFDWRYPVFHGIALGVCGTSTELLFRWFGYTTSGWVNGLASLGVCAVLMAGFYCVALIAEGVVIYNRRCRECGQRGLDLDP